MTGSSKKIIDGQCFVAMPFGEKSEALWLEGISKPLTELEFFPYRVDKAVRSATEIAEAIKENIARSEYVIADITGNKPNVFYEIGIAEGQDKPLVLLTRNAKIGRLPFDISNLNTMPCPQPEHAAKYLTELFQPVGAWDYINKNLVTRRWQLDKDQVVVIVGERLADVLDLRRAVTWQKSKLVAGAFLPSNAFPESSPDRNAERPTLCAISAALILRYNDVVPAHSAFLNHAIYHLHHERKIGRVATYLLQEESYSEPEKKYFRIEAGKIQGVEIFDGNERAVHCRCQKCQSCRTLQKLAKYLEQR